MKRIIILLLTIIMATVLSGCGCKHEWEPATCDKPKTCKLCGETEGEPSEHLWLEASCEKPKTCSQCGKQEGSALGHKWEEATCTEPKKCSVCGKTEGEALGHDFTPATLDKPKTCKVCGETEGEPVSFSIIDTSFMDDADWPYVINDEMCVAYRENPKHCYTLTFYDYNGNELNEQVVDVRNADGSWNGWNINIAKEGYLIAVGDEIKSNVKIYDYDFNLILEKEISTSAGYEDGRAVDLDFCSFDGLERVYDTKTNESYFGVDMVNRCECPLGDYYEAAAKQGVTVDYDTSKWSCHVYQDCIKGYLVGTADGSSWGYVDMEDNEIKMFKDATAFSQSGYALVTSDGEKYDLIDADMRVVAEDIIEGNSASGSGHGNAFIIYKDNGKKVFVSVK